MAESDQSERDAGCLAEGAMTPNLPGTTLAPGPIPPQAMTACKASALIQKRIG